MITIAKLKKAIEKIEANQKIEDENDREVFYEVDGIAITDPTMSSCGRFDNSLWDVDFLEWVETL